MIIKIDTREHELLKICEWTKQAAPKYKDVQLISETLPLGDIIINDGTNDCVIIERKTLSDLAASIKDGRYEEQSYRLNGLNHHNHNIIYLIEGDMNRFNTFKERIDKQTLYSAMFSINYFKGFSVMRSNSIEETALIACNMAFKLVASGKTGFYTNNISNTNTNTDTNLESDEKKEQTDKDYCSVVKKVKKENITPENIGEIMLCQIPGISVASALAILAQFKTLPNLIKNIQEDSTCLNNICTTDANGKNRKISKTAIATIIKFLG
jgi:ERCC4-type nuclease